MPKSSTNRLETLDTQIGDTAYSGEGDTTTVINLDTSVYTVSEQVFFFEVTGLKPGTKHLFYFEDVDRSSKCKPTGGNLGANLVSSAQGILSFEFYYDAGLPADTTYTDYVQQQSYYASIAGTKKIAVKNSDETSKAEDTITIQVESLANTSQIDPSVSNSVFGTSGGSRWINGPTRAF